MASADGGALRFDGAGHIFLDSNPRTFEVGRPLGLGTPLWVGRPSMGTPSGGTPLFLPVEVASDIAVWRGHRHSRASRPQRAQGARRAKGGLHLRHSVAHFPCPAWQAVLDYLRDGTVALPATAFELSKLLLDARKFKVCAAGGGSQVALQLLGHQTPAALRPPLAAGASALLSGRRRRLVGGGVPHAHHLQSWPAKPSWDLVRGGAVRRGTGAAGALPCTRASRHPCALCLQLAGLEALVQGALPRPAQGPPVVARAYSANDLHLAHSLLGGLHQPIAPAGFAAAPASMPLAAAASGACMRLARVWGPPAGMPPSCLSWRYACLAELAFSAYLMELSPCCRAGLQGRLRCRQCPRPRWQRQWLRASSRSGRCRPPR